MGITYLNTPEPPQRPPATARPSPPPTPTPAPGQIHGADGGSEWTFALVVLGIIALVFTFGFAAGHAWALR